MGAQNTTEKGTEYELLVQQVLNMLHTAEGVEQINIQHNVKLTGISGTTHQIDLYWEFKIAGIIYRVAVECKGYSSPVSKEKITSFKGVLDDLGGISGIYVCKSGYQKGAKQYAEAHGIQLLEVRKPTDKDWNGRMRNIHLQLHYMSKDNFKVSFVVDKGWAEQNCVVKPEGFHAMTDETIIEIPSDEAMHEKRDECVDQLSDCGVEQATGIIRRTILDFIMELPSDKAGAGFEKVYKYDNAFLVYKDSSVQDDSVSSEVRLKIREFKIVYDVKDYVDNIDIYGDDIVMAIVKNITERTEKTVAWNGRVWDREGLESKA